MVDRIFPGSGVNSFLRSNSIIKGSDDTQENAKTLEEITTLDIPRPVVTSQSVEGYCPYRNRGGGVTGVMNSVKNGVSSGITRMRRFHPMGHVNYGGFSIGRLVIFILFLFIVVYIFTSPYVSRKMHDIKDTITSNTSSLASDIVGKRQGGLGNYSRSSLSDIKRRVDALSKYNKYSSGNYTTPSSSYKYNSYYSTPSSSHKYRGGTISMSNPINKDLVKKYKTNTVNYANKEIF